MSISNKNIADIRKDYQLAALDEQSAGDDPFVFFSNWFQQAVDAHADEVNAMTLATVDALHKPHARIVLLKGLTEKGFTFFTNYESEKGQNIADNPNVALVFFWKELERQVRIEGVAEMASPEESDAYFLSRPANSRLGAWSSPQSKVITDRDILDNNYEGFEKQFGENIPRPPHWGGYTVVANRIEFWQGRSSRMHDRILFSLDSKGFWAKSRLAP